MPRAVIYARISDRDRNVPAVANQEAHCRALAKREGYEVVEVFSDDGKSAFKPGVSRDGFVDLMAAVKEGKADVVLAVHQDRFARDEEVRVAFTALCARAGVVWHFTDTGKVDPSTAEGGLLATVMGGLATFESTIKKQRLRRSVSDRLSKGMDLGGPRPFGFEPDRRTIRESEAALVREAYQRILDGGSIRSIANDWTDLGVKRDRSPDMPWRSQTVHSIVLRERNAGRLVVKGVQHADDLPRLVEPETFDAVKAILENPARRPKRGPEPSRWAASSVLRCATCGSFLSQRRSSTGKPEMRCATESRPLEFQGKEHRHATMLAEPLERELRHHVGNQIMSRSFEPAGTGGAALVRERIAGLVAERTHVQKVAMIPGADLSLAGKRLAQLATEIEVAEADLAERLAGSVTERVRDLRDMAMELPANLWDRFWDDLTLTDRRTLVRACLTNARLLPARDAWSGFRVDWDGRPD